MSDNFITVQAILPDPKNYPENLVPIIDGIIRDTLRGEIYDIVSGSMLKRVKLWRAKPKMLKIYRRPSMDRFELFVEPGGSTEARLRWKWTSRGTRPSVRTAHNPSGFMWFRDYNPKTEPGNVYGNPPPRRTGPLRRASTVTTSVPARNFEEHVIEEVRDSVVNALEKKLYINLRRAT